MASGMLWTLLVCFLKTNKNSFVLAQYHEIKLKQSPLLVWQPLLSHTHLLCPVLLLLTLPCQLRLNLSLMRSLHCTIIRPVIQARLPSILYPLISYSLSVCLAGWKTCSCLLAFSCFQPRFSGVLLLKATIRIPQCFFSADFPKTLPLPKKNKNVTKHTSQGLMHWRKWIQFQRFSKHKLKPIISETTSLPSFDTSPAVLWFLSPAPRFDVFPGSNSYYSCFIGIVG